MKRYIAYLEVGYAGMDACEAFIMPDNHTEDELSQVVWEMAVEHASGYGVEVGDADSFDSEDDEEEMSGENVSGYAEIYDPDKHDSLRSGGGSFVLDFEHLEK